MDDHFRLLDVLPELLVHIFSFLSNDDICSIRLTSRYLSNFIASSVELRYQVARGVEHVTDNPASPVPISERLTRLNAQTRAFLEMQPSLVCSTTVPFLAAGLYELSGGQLWLGEFERQALRYMVLPTEPAAKGSPPIPWERIALASERSVIIDFGLAIDEHDLVILATFTPTRQSTPVVLKRGLVESGLVKLEFLTVSFPHVPHPQARGSIEVGTSQWGLPNVIIECVGDFLVFVVAYASTPYESRVDDHVYVYNWKTSALLWETTAEGWTYFGAVFLSTDVLLLPNTTTATLEIWLLTAGQTAPALTLHLPRLVPGMTIRTMTARGEPNPSVSGRRNRNVPFHSSAEDSIILFHLIFPAAPGHLRPEFIFFVHRRALLALLAGNQGEEKVNYADWGPDICRWINTEGVVTDWITTTSGQRCVILPIHHAPTSFILFDFNPHTVRASTSRIPPEDDPFVDYGLFGEPVGSRLPVHVARTREKTSAYSGVSMDDQRIIAFKRNELRQVKEIDVYYFGG
ncbi:hypothetical protein C8R46DRAFT_1097901 [Mycena filopes]|nr:hypothetical protein C8R46DRAFT_1097901 [Mycena filopes]